MAFAPKVEKLLKELDRIAMLPYRWNDEEVVRHLKEFYKIYDMPFPKKVEVCVDIFDERLKDLVARQAGQAWQAWQARQAGQAGQAWQAGQARQAGQAWQARQARQAGQAWQARQARQAVEYGVDYFEGEMVFVEQYAAEHGTDEHDKKLLAGQYALLKAKEAGLGFFFDDEKTVYLVPCAVVRLNNANMHHSDEFPAIEWVGGQSLHYLNGVYFPKELWAKVVSRKMPFAKILAIEDIDQRTQAMRYGNIEEFLQHVGAKTLDTYQKFLPTGEPVNYTYYEIPTGPNSPFTEAAYYMRYSCPSTGKDYISGVAKPMSTAELTVPHAMSWKFSDPENGLEVTPDMWKQLVPLVTES